MIPCIIVTDRYIKFIRKSMFSVQFIIENHIIKATNRNRNLTLPCSIFYTIYFFCAFIIFFYMSYTCSGSSSYIRSCIIYCNSIFRSGSSIILSRCTCPFPIYKGVIRKLILIFAVFLNSIFP